jgi:tetratricopeptide (TPR) repeat protein
MANLETPADMSLLLEARRKSRQAQSAQPDSTPDSGPPDQFDPGATDNATQFADQARSAGHKLFAAKSPFPVTGHTLPNRNLLYALGGTLLLLAVGMAYFWHLNSASDTTPLRGAELAPPIRIPPAAATPTRAAPDAKSAEPDAITGSSETLRLTAPAESASAATPHPLRTTPQRSAPPPNATAPRPDSSPVRIEQRKTETVDPLLEDAYFAYRGGKLDEARRLYLAMLEKDARNPDALLGLAAIAQRHGENRAAAQYFGRVLALDPRNAAANAGMSALSTDEDYSESRLKILLREQGDSATLHFALGNLYAGQARWSEAQQAYFNAYALESGNAEYAFNLAVSLDHIGQKKLAARHYLRAMQLDPSRSAGFDHSQISQRAQELARQ